MLRGKAADAPLVAVDSNHWGQSRGSYHGPFSTDVYGFNADGTSFAGWSGSYGALIGPDRWGIPLPGESGFLTREEGITDVSYARGSLYVATFTMGMGSIFQVDPRSGTPTARINVPQEYGRANANIGRAGWVPAAVTRIPGYAGFLALDPTSGPALTVNWYGTLSAPQAGPGGALYFAWSGWWEGLVTPQWGGPVTSLYAGHTREILRYTGDPLHPGTGDWESVIPDVGLTLDGYSTSAMLLTPDDRVLLVAPEGIRAYDAISGQFLNTLVQSGPGGLSQPTGLVQGPGNTLWVTDQGTDQILRFDSQTGAPLGPLTLLNFQLLSDPQDLDFLDGHQDTLLVSQRHSPYLLRISHVHGPGPALVTPFSPESDSLFGPLEYSMSIAVIPEASPGWLAALAGLAGLARMFQAGRSRDAGRRTGACPATGRAEETPSGSAGGDHAARGAGAGDGW